MPDPPALTPSPPSPRQGPGWWLWPQVVGLDAPIVAVAWLASLAHSHRVHLTPAFYLGIVVATWLLYLLDRTMDARSGKLLEPLSERHAFCRRHANVIIMIITPLLLLSGGYIALWHLPRALGTQAMLVGLLCIWYLAFHGGRDDRGLQRTMIFVALGGSVWLLLKLTMPGWLFMISLGLLFFAAMAANNRSQRDARWIFKEMSGGLLFALGCVASVHVWAQDGHDILCPETCMLWALATLNLLMIHCSERETGRHGEHAPATPNTWHRVREQRLLLIAVTLSLGFVCFTARNPGTRAVAVSSATSALLMLMLHLRVRKLEAQAFHFFADAALVLPLPLVWLIGAK